MSCDIVDDIEDILKLNAATDESKHLGIEEFNRSLNGRSLIIPKPKKVSKNEQTKESDIDQDNGEQLNLSSNVPGVAAIYVKTWGCTHNSSDSEYMAGQLAAYGYKIIGEQEQQKKNTSDFRNKHLWMNLYYLIILRR